MAKVKTAELTGAALDWAVGVAEGRQPGAYKGVVRATAHPDCPDSAPMFGPELNYSTGWAQAGPLLNQHKISRTIDHSGLWIAYAGYNLNDEQRHMQCDRSELVAGLRCLVALNLGEVVDVPEELL